VGGSATYTHRLDDVNLSVQAAFNKPYFDIVEAFVAEGVHDYARVSAQWNWNERLQLNSFLGPNRYRLQSIDGEALSFLAFFDLNYRLFVWDVWHDTTPFAFIAPGYEFYGEYFWQRHAKLPLDSGEYHTVYAWYNQPIFKKFVFDALLGASFERIRQIWGPRLRIGLIGALLPSLSFNVNYTLSTVNPLSQGLLHGIFFDVQIQL